MPKFDLDELPVTSVAELTAGTGYSTPTGPTLQDRRRFTPGRRRPRSNSRRTASRTCVDGGLVPAKRAAAWPTSS